MRQGHKKGYLDGKDLLEDIEDYRDNINLSRFLDASYSYANLGLIVERELRRRANSVSATFEPSEKQKLEAERDKYKNRCDSLYQWFAYYQDKCKEKERKDGKESKS